MDETSPVIVMLAVFVLIVVFASGFAAASSGITDDCESMGLFRYGSTVYECKPAKPD